jgi:nucleotide-binding universal stress UspA family protein
MRRAPSSYKAILVATDGSAHARRAARVAARLAGACDARLFAIHVTVERVPTIFTGSKLYASPALSPELHAALRREAERALADAGKEARAAGVECAALHARARHPWRAILGAARRHRCDLVVMGAHGRGGIVGELLGGQATQVLAHSKMPVLVCR